MNKKEIEQLAQSLCETYTEQKIKNKEILKYEKEMTLAKSDFISTLNPEQRKKFDELQTLMNAYQEERDFEIVNYASKCIVSVFQSLIGDSSHLFD